MKTNNSQWLKPVLALIQKYAPNTYEAMVNCDDWNVNAVTTYADLLPIMEAFNDSPQEMHYVFDRFNHALGCTFCNLKDNLVPWDGPDELKNTTWMNHKRIMMNSTDGHVNPVRLAASVLVHEWTHRRGYGEKEAYATAARFARSMGEEEIARAQERTWRRVQYEEMMGAYA